MGSIPIVKGLVRTRFVLPISQSICNSPVTVTKRTAYLTVNFQESELTVMILLAELRIHRILCWNLVWMFTVTSWLCGDPDRRREQF